MNYQALYRTYRPTTFDEVVGQKYIVKTLENAIKQGKIAHAYLFSGPRGTGKTSIAKIFARVLNCQEEVKPCLKCDSCIALKQNTHPDIIEMDAASNNSVEDIREIISSAAYAPIMSKYKVYIIDEVHMLSNSAFNALLKTLEEPPSNVVFILATTEVNKVIPTVLSRVQQFNFKKVEEKDIVERMKFILEKENYSYDLEALEVIASISDGGVRDALSILDQCLVYGEYKISKEIVFEAFGIISKESKIDLVTKIINADIESILKIAKKYYEDGVDLKRLINDILIIYKDIYIYLATGSSNNLKILNVKDVMNFKVDLDYVAFKIDIILNLINKYNYATFDYFQLLLIKLSKNENTSSNAIEVMRVNINQEEDVDYDFLLGILKNATKNYKNEDLYLLEKIDEYLLDSEYRKFATVIKNSNLIASSKDAVILESDEKYKINDELFNQELYYFLVDNLKIEKMIYAINENDKNKLFDFYKEKRFEIEDVVINKYPPKDSGVEKNINKYFNGVEIV